MWGFPLGGDWGGVCEVKGGYLGGGGYPDILGVCGVAECHSVGPPEARATRVPLAHACAVALSRLPGAGVGANPGLADPGRLGTGRRGCWEGFFLGGWGVSPNATDPCPRGGGDTGKGGGTPGGVGHRGGW